MPLERDTVDSDNIVFRVRIVASALWRDMRLRRRAGLGKWLSSLSGNTVGHLDRQSARWVRRDDRCDLCLIGELVIVLCAGGIAGMAASGEPRPGDGMGNGHDADGSIHPPLELITPSHRVAYGVAVNTRNSTA